MLLEGIRVTELATAIFVPYCGTHLTDFGAEVIKIEEPSGQDMMRGLRLAGGDPATSRAFLYDQNNRGKRNLTLDLNQEAGQEVTHKLVARSDVFLTNLRVRVLRRMHMDYETLSQINPRLIYALGTGYGIKGPEKDRGGFDYGAWAYSGPMLSFGEPGSLPPQIIDGFGDHVSAMNLFAAILLALYHRERTGEGQMVHASLYGSLLDAGSFNLQQVLASDREYTRKDRLAAPNPLCNSYITKDSRWLMITSKQADRSWHDFCAAVGIEHLEKDPRFGTTESRANHCRELIAILDPIFASYTLAEWEERLNRPNVFWAPALTYGEVAKHPQAWEMGYITEADHPHFGRYKTWTNSLYLDKTPFQIKHGAAELGQHNEEILLDLGYTWEDIVRLKDSHVIL